MLILMWIARMNWWKMSLTKSKMSRTIYEKNITVLVNFMEIMHSHHSSFKKTDLINKLSHSNKTFEIYHIWQDTICLPGLIFDENIPRNKRFVFHIITISFLPTLSPSLSTAIGSKRKLGRSQNSSDVPSYRRNYKLDDT